MKLFLSWELILSNLLNFQSSFLDPYLRESKWMCTSLGTQTGFDSNGTEGVRGELLGRGVPGTGTRLWQRWHERQDSLWEPSHSCGGTTERLGDASLYVGFWEHGNRGRNMCFYSITLKTIIWEFAQLDDWLQIEIQKWLICL